MCAGLISVMVWCGDPWSGAPCWSSDSSSCVSGSASHTPTITASTQPTLCSHLSLPETNIVTTFIFHRHYSISQTKVLFFTCKGKEIMHLSINASKCLQSCLISQVLRCQLIGINQFHQYCPQSAPGTDLLAGPAMSHTVWSTEQKYLIAQTTAEYLKLFVLSGVCSVAGSYCRYLSNMFLSASNIIGPRNYLYNRGWLLINLV